MSNEAHWENRRAAAEYLRQLLLKPGRYRETWQQHVARPRDGVINQMAVAQVIADRLRAAPDHPGDAQMMPYQLQETVSGTLSGRQLSKQTLELFIAAFGFSQHEAERLQRLWRGSSRITVLSGSHGVPPQAEQEVDRAFGPRLYRTVSLHDQVYVGEDGRIDRARAIQVIEATARDVDRIPFLCDTNVLTLEVGQGGQEMSGEVRQIGDDVFFTEIVLASALDVGETTTLECWITYRYPGDLADPAEREFRRAVIRQAENLDIRVQFQAERLPRQVWWSRWDGIEGDVLEEELVTLDSEYSAQRYLRSLDKTVVGFHWQW